jgi:hypothetical protein
VPVTVFLEEPTLIRLSSLLLDKLDEVESAASDILSEMSVTGGHLLSEKQAAQLLTQLDRLSEDQVEQLLTELMYEEETGI